MSFIKISKEQKNEDLISNFIILGSIIKVINNKEYLNSIKEMILETLCNIGMHLSNLIED
jgi:hypothetical protein